LQIEDGDSHGEIVLRAMPQLSVKQVLGAFGFDRALPSFAQGFAESRERKTDQQEIV
jgi:hypothetical protein